MLLERADINPNTADTQYNLTPLGRAAEKGHQGVVKLLLERQDINPNTADTKYGRTPLLWAAGHGHERVVRLLLKRGDINPNAADTEHSLTPLLWAVERGHEGVVKLLLEHADLDPDLPGQTALEVAESREHAGIVNLISQLKPSPQPPRYPPELSDSHHHSLQQQPRASKPALRLLWISIIMIPVATVSITIYAFTSCPSRPCNSC